MNFVRFIPFLLFFAIGVFSFYNSAFAHEAPGPTLSEEIAKNSISIVTVSGALILLLVIISVLKKERGLVFSGIIFGLIVILTVGPTLYLSASTIHLNKISESGGPVHWHADFRIFKCGQEVFLEKPRGLSNRIGKTDLHEHGDGRIHIEGVVVRREEFSLHKFFEAIGGNLTTGEMDFPGANGREWWVNGHKCQDGQSARLQVFLYKTEGETIRQTKLQNFPEYVPSPHSQIPPGDCLIFEFSPEQKERTDKICNFMDIAIKQGRYKYEK